MGQAQYGAMHRMLGQLIKARSRILGAAPKHMFTPISKVIASAFLLAALASCGGDDARTLEQVEKDTAEQAAREGKIECALASSTAFERVCTTEQISATDGAILVIRHPDGGFRRFNILTDGRGLSPADGFDETRIRLLDDSSIELTSGDDKYRLPAQVKGREQPVADTVGKDTG